MIVGAVLRATTKELLIELIGSREVLAQGVNHQPPYFWARVRHDVRTQSR